MTLCTLLSRRIRTKRHQQRRSCSRAAIHRLEAGCGSVPGCLAHLTLWRVGNCTTGGHLHTYPIERGPFETKVALYVVYVGIPVSMAQVDAREK